MKIELSRFKVVEGKSQRVGEWMSLLRNNRERVLLTLQGEKMFIETIFRENTPEGEFLYWYSIQGEGGVSVENSTHEIDKQHLELWKECIEPNSRKDIIMEVSMIQEYLMSKME